MNKIRLFLMLLAMLSCVVSGYAYEDTFFSFEFDGIWYEVTKLPDEESSGEVNVRRNYSSKYTGNIVIPSEITRSDGIYEVTGIGLEAFVDCNRLFSITIPESVTSIGEGAFYNCSGLRSITIPNSVKSIGNHAFVGCSGLTSIILGDHLTTIGERTFYNLTKLSSITIPNSVSSIGNFAFMGCSGLTSVILGDHLTTVGEKTFFGCSNLSSITIPNSVTTIGEGAFNGCSGLKLITSKISTPFDVNAFGNFIATLVVPKGTRFDYKNVSGWNFAFIYEEGETIYDRAQTEEQGVKYKLKQTDDNSFYYSVTGYTEDMNTDLVIPAYIGGFPVRTIEGYVFNGCTNLSSITIPSSVTSIGLRAFYGCSGLKQVISELSAPFDVDVFDNFNATLIVPKGSRADYKNVSGWNFAFIYEEGETFYDKVQTDEQGVLYTLMQADDFYYSVTGHSSKLSSEIVIPADLSGIPVKSIGYRAFHDCSGMTSVTIPNSVTSLGNNAFGSCYELTSVTIPSSVTFGIGVFDGCRLKNVKVVVMDYSDFCNNNVVGRFNCAIQLLDNDGNEITEYIIPEGVTTIGYNAFMNCRGLISITIPGSVTSIDEFAFGGCNFKNVKVVVMDYSDFCNNHVVGSFNCAIQLLDNNGNEITEYIVPEGVTTIGYNAFMNCSSLTSVTISKSVTSIGNYAFGNCSGLRLVTSEISSPFDVHAFNNFDATLVVPKGSRANYKSVSGWNFAFTYEEGETFYDREQTDEQGLYYTLIQADDYSVYYSVTGHSDELNTEVVIPTDLDGCPVKAIDESAFIDCTDLSSIIIPNSVTTIGKSAFSGCSGLTSVKIGNGVTCLEAATFHGCSSLTTIKIPNSVTSIEDGYREHQWAAPDILYGVFSGCSGLTSITIPNSVTRIGNYAFSGCSGLTSVKIGNNVISIGENAFSSCTSLNTIILPNMLESIDAGAFSESSLMSVNIPGSVKTIGNGAFKNCSRLVSVSLEDGITTIGEHAFYQCALTSITIPNSVTYIGSYAFGYSSLKTAILGNGITDIKVGTFRACGALSSVIISDGVTYIGWEAFGGCSFTSIKLPESLSLLDEDVFPNSLKSIELPNSFTTIPDELFAGNTNLQYIKLGNNVKSIGKNAFGSSSPVIVIDTPTPPAIASDAFPNVEYLSDLNVIVPDAKAETAYRKAAVWQEMTFSNQNNISEVTVETPGDLGFELITQCNMMPAKVVGMKVNGTINADDFNQMLVNMKSLLRLDLSDCNITAIPDNAMKGKMQLKELILPTKLQTIGQSAFQGCTFLSELTMQNGLQTIGKNAFQDCTYLTGELNLPSTLTTIGESAFVGTDYSSVKLPNTLKTIDDYAFYNVPIKQQLTLPKKVTSLGASAFAGTKITGLEIPDGVTSIGDNAFADTPIEGHVTIPDGVTYLGKGAFRNSQLSTVFLPNSVTELSQGVFQGCPNLDLVYVPDNYTGLSSSVFDGCGALQILRLSANLTSMGSYSLQNTPLEYIKVPSQVEVLSQGVLKNCKSLESLSLPSSLKTVEGEALYGCTALRNLSIEAIEPPVIKDRSAIRGINTDLCLISIPTQSYRKYVLAEYWGQFVQMRNDIAVETSGNGEIAFESVNDDEEEEEYETREYGMRRTKRRAPQLASDEESMAIANNGSSIYVPQQGQVRFYILPAEGEKILSATLDGVDIMPYIVDGVYTATADKRKAKLVVKFSGSGGSAVKTGDVNGDGDVDIADAVMIVNHVVGKPTPSFVEEAADVNNDGDIDIADAVRIVNLVVGKIPSLTRQYNYFLPDPQ